MIWGQAKTNVYGEAFSIAPRRHFDTLETGSKTSATSVLAFAIKRSPIRDSI